MPRHAPSPSMRLPARPLRRSERVTCWIEREHARHLARAATAAGIPFEQLLAQILRDWCHRAPGWQPQLGADIEEAPR